MDVGPEVLLGRRFPLLASIGRLVPFDEDLALAGTQPQQRNALVCYDVDLEPSLADLAEGAGGDLGLKNLRTSCSKRLC